jgi:flap endonuclease GEN
MASSPSTPLLLCDQYEFHSIQRIKIRYGYPYYLVKWKKATRGMISSGCTKEPEMEGGMNREVVVSDDGEEETTVASESPELLDEPDAPQVITDGSCTFLLTDEDIQLVNAAFPTESIRFQEEQVGIG